jgi:hypothetical protein
MRRKTNEQIVRDLMRFSRFGALSQVFVIDAIRKHADRVARATPDQIGDGLISAEAWIGVAQEIKAIMDQAYEGDQ